MVIEDNIIANNNCNKKIRDNICPRDDNNDN